MLSKRYKWVLVTNYRTIHCVGKPKAVRGGFMTGDGHRYLGPNVQLFSRKTYDDPWIEVDDE